MPEHPSGPILYRGQDPFEYHKPTDEQTLSIMTVRQACRDLYQVLLAEVPPSAERTLAIRKLEECSMWSNKGIVFYLESLPDPADKEPLPTWGNAHWCVKDGYARAGYAIDCEDCNPRSAGTGA